MAGHLDGIEGLSMRQVCNVAYALQVESMDENEYRKFNKELEAAPGQRVSHGTGALMGLMGGAR